MKTPFPEGVRFCHSIQTLLPQVAHIAKGHPAGQVVFWFQLIVILNCKIQYPTKLIQHNSYCIERSCNCILSQTMSSERSLKSKFFSIFLAIIFIFLGLSTLNYPLLDLLFLLGFLMVSSSHIQTPKTKFYHFFFSIGDTSSGRYSKGTPCQVKSYADFSSLYTQVQNTKFYINNPTWFLLYSKSFQDNYIKLCAKP